MVVAIYVVGIVIGLCLLGALIGAFTMNSDPLTDEQLYGMDGEEYTRKMMGEETYEKYKNK